LASFLGCIEKGTLFVLKNAPFSVALIAQGFLAEKERFELQDSLEIWYYSTIICTNTSRFFSGLS